VILTFDLLRPSCVTTTGAQKVKGQGHTRSKVDLEASLSTPVHRVAFLVTYLRCTAGVFTNKSTGSRSWMTDMCNIYHKFLSWFYYQAVVKMWSVSSVTFLRTVLINSKCVEYAYSENVINLVKLAFLTAHGLNNKLCQIGNI